MERTNDALEQRSNTLQAEVARLGERAEVQAQKAQTLQERLSEALLQLKLIEHSPLANGGADSHEPLPGPEADTP